MKWLWNKCRRREEICLLAAGALPDHDRPEMERHLAACSGCRNYYHEIKAFTAPLSAWEKNFAKLEPTQAMQSRWSGAVQATAAEADLRGTLLNQIWRELIWPCRRVWVGLAALWLALLAVNLQLSDHTIQPVDTRSSFAMIQSWEEQTRVLAELTQPDIVSAPVIPALTPGTLPRPRSARKQDWQVV